MLRIFQVIDVVLGSAFFLVLLYSAIAELRKPSNSLVPTWFSTAEIFLPLAAQQAVSQSTLQAASKAIPPPALAALPHTTRSAIPPTTNPAR